MRKEWASLKRPYDRRDFADLPEAHRAKIAENEIGLYGAVSLSVAKTRDTQAIQWADDRGIERTDEKTLIDKPLQHLKDLAQAYAESGLAQDDAEAKRMADAYKDAIVERLVKMLADRGTLR
jgi:hypothetical protein